MLIRSRFKFRLPPLLFLLFSILLSWFPGVISSAIVKLNSIEIFTTHEWLKSEPTVYFHCKGENTTDLPDVKKKNVLYAFKGEESWQPLTDFANKKCKRCGFYEKDVIKADDVFDEWEFCPSDFVASDGIYIHFKEKELNATFLCPDCSSLGDESKQATGTHSQGKGLHWTVVIVIAILVSFVFVLGVLGGYKYWQKRKREKEQARFLKLFEEGDDDIEDELGIGPLSNAV